MLSEAEWATATPGVLGLRTLEMIASPFHEKDLVSMMCVELQNVCFSHDKIKKLAVLEWTRLNPNMIVEFILRMDKEQLFQSMFKRCYKDLRKIFIYD